MMDVDSRPYHIVYNEWKKTTIGYRATLQMVVKDEATATTKHGYIAT